MSTPVLTFFSNKSGVGRTSLVYHLAWMFSEMGKKVVAVDLDPQANLTSAFLEEDELEKLWDPATAVSRSDTIHQCVRPLSRTGDPRPPNTVRITPSLHLLPGDLNLSAFEDLLSQEWPDSLSGDSDIRFRAMRVLTSFWQVAQMAAEQMTADIILADIGPNLGAINRSVLIGTDFVVIPLAADLFSLQGLRNLGPSLQKWRAEWNDRVQRWTASEFAPPRGRMEALGYIVRLHNKRVSRPVDAYDRWIRRIPSVYRESVLGEAVMDGDGIPPENDPYCLSRLKHYRSLIPMAHEARKPIFRLTSADGAIGSHSHAVSEARSDFEKLARKLLRRIHMPADES